MFDRFVIVGQRRWSRRLASPAAWAAEVAGIAAIAAGGWLAWEPVGLVIPGVYLVLVANRPRSAE
jgi:hypothetical protein